MGMGKWGRLLRVDILFGEQKDRPNPLTLIPYSVIGARALGFFFSTPQLTTSPSSRRHSGQAALAPQTSLHRLTGDSGTQRRPSAPALLHRVTEIQGSRRKRLRTKHTTDKQWPQLVCLHLLVGISPPNSRVSHSTPPTIGTLLSSNLSASRPTFRSISSPTVNIHYSLKFSTQSLQFLRIFLLLDKIEAGTVSLSPMQKRPLRRSIVCEAAPPKKADSAAKRARQAEKRRIFNKAKKSEVLEALDGLRKKRDAQQDEVLEVEKLIAEAYSAIDKAVKAGTVHRNTGARRKSRLARRKKAVEIHHGWYVPAPAPDATPIPVATV
nr:30S ribosomal protein S20, chloroplastic [Ipomoea batatas]